MVKNDVVQSLVSGIFVFVGFLVAEELDKYLSKYSFLANKLVAGLVWIVLGVMLAWFVGRRNIYVMDISLGFYTAGLYDIVSNYISL